jgi:hypothetical protein
MTVKNTGLIETLDLDHIKAMAAQGMSRQQIGSFYGVTGQWIGKLVKKHPELEEAFNAGLAQGINRASNKLMELIESGNIVAILFYLKCQAGWVEQQYVKEKLDESNIPRVQIFIPDNQRDGLLVETVDSEIEQPEAEQPEAEPC